MKRLFFIFIIVFFSSCNLKENTRLKNENAQLILRIDSLKSELERMNIIASQQKELAVTMQKVAEQRRIEAEMAKRECKELLKQKSKK